jgi:hypothetical protein
MKKYAKNINHFFIRRKNGDLMKNHIKKTLLTSIKKLKGSALSEIFHTLYIYHPVVSVHNTRNNNGMNSLHLFVALSSIKMEAKNVNHSAITVILR